MRTMTRKTILVSVMLAVGSWGCEDDSGSPAVTTDAGSGSGSDAAKDGSTDGASPDAGSTTPDAGDDAAAPEIDAAPVDGSEGDGGLTTIQARGQYLVDHVIACGDCHTPQLPTGGFDKSKYLAGGFCFIPGSNGTCLLQSRNLTNDETGLKSRTDAEIKSMFLDGKRPAATGDEPLFPVMPYYVFHNMKSDDADAIVAYLRTVPAVNNAIPKRDVSLAIPGPAAPLTLAAIPAVPADYAAKESAERGKYLTTQIGLCVECHTQHTAPGSPTVLDETKLFQGGENFSALFPPAFMWRIVSRNITSDVATGAGKLSVDDIVKVLHEGVKMDGKPICPPMPAGKMAAYGGLTDADATDIANYIHSLPAKTNATGVNMCAPPGPPPADGGATDTAVTPDMSVATDTGPDGV
jgi:mono/diheme cytochrome c family protein